MINVTVSNGVVSLRLADGLRQFEERKPRMFQNIGHFLQKQIQLGFDHERAPDGTPWEPLKASTVRQRKGDAHPILQRDGDLARGIGSTVTVSGVITGSMLKYAAVHQFGATIRAGGRGNARQGLRSARAKGSRSRSARPAGRGRIRIPARPYLFNRDGSVPEQWLQGIVSIVQQFMGLENGTINRIA